MKHTAHHTSTIEDIKKRIASGESVRAIVEEALAKAEAEKDYNTLISVARDVALARADELDARRKKGEDIGVLGGVPYVAKDIFLAHGTIATAGSNILRNFDSPYQATAVNRLEAVGAVLIGKANNDAFGNGGSTENSDYGITKNPYDKTRVAGGSSGGSTAAVALGIVPFAIGGDTGGSCRQPASFCGVLGIKPTYGGISRYGVIPYTSSLDTIGAITNTADDAALLFDIMAGQDERDSTTLPDRPASFMPKDNPVKALRIGILKEHMREGVVEDEVLAGIRKAADQLVKLGHKVEDVSMPTLDSSLAAYYIVAPAELSSNLLRYDGVKFGHVAEGAKTLQDLYGLSRDEGFNAENKRRILIGTYVLSSGYIDAYYRKAQTVRTKLINEYNKTFENYDVLIGPVAPTTAFKIGENSDPLQMYLQDLMTVGSSLAGLPAMSVPVGFDGKGLPIGLHMVGPQRSDALLLSLAKQLEGAQ
jgi:aspartyl-tRNA(Asn)/glutamyl-tRNA(Gln) amidotransferase subunit A